MTRVLLRGVAVASFLLPACAGSRNASPPTTAIAGPVVPGPPPWIVEPVATIDAGRGRVHSVIAWGHYVAWAAADSPDADPDQVFVHDLNTKTTKVVARTRFRGGTIPRLRASNESIVYVDTSRVATPDDAETNWRMYEVSPEGGKPRELLASVGKADRENPPLPSVAWPWVAWFQATETAVSVRSLDLRDGRQRTLVPTTSGTQLSFDDVTGRVYYDDDNGTGGRDVFAVPADGSGAPARATSSGRADFPIARNGGLVWQEPPQMDSDSLWYMSTAAVAAPVQFSSPSEIDYPTAGSNGFPGKSFVVWLAGPRLVMRDTAVTSSPHPLQEANVSIFARWWVDGNRVVWATLTDIGAASEKSTVHLVNVRH